MAQQVIADGSAFAKCKEMFAAQGGDVRVLEDYSLFAQPAATWELLADADGYIVENDAEKIGTASVPCWAPGARRRASPWTTRPGSVLHKKRGRLRPPRGQPGHLLRRARAALPPPQAAYRAGLRSSGPKSPPSCP